MARMRNSRIAAVKGFTLIEVLIAAVIAAIALTAGFQVLIDHNKSHLIQAGVSDMQQNGRSAVEELVGNIRRAGYRLPGMMPALSAWNTNPDTIAMAFLAEPVCTASLSHAMPQPSAELKCVGSNLSCFDDDMWAYIYDPVVDSGEFFFITHVQESAGHLQHNLAPLSKKYQPGAQVFLLTYYKYYVDQSDTLHPKMMILSAGGTPNIFADEIEDLEFRYVHADGTVRDTITESKYVREVFINVMARTTKNDLFLNDYRRDTLSTRVKVRNL